MFDDNEVSNLVQTAMDVDAEEDALRTALEAALKERT